MVQDILSVKVGFTGTQKGLLVFQRSILKIVLQKLHVTEFHHGDCIGADETAHDLMNAKCDIIIHPPSDPKKRAWCQPVYGRILPEKPYLERNHDIVDATTILVATPDSPNEKSRSGTWATVRYAKRLGRPIYLIPPDGKVVLFNV